jgi:hypothetical protein
MFASKDLPLSQLFLQISQWLVYKCAKTTVCSTSNLLQAPKRRAAPAGPSAPPKPRLTKLAKENNITNEQESEIREAFSLFAVKVEPDFKDEKEGVMKRDDVRRCLM